MLYYKKQHFWGVTVMFMKKKTSNKLFDKYLKLIDQKDKYDIKLKKKYFDFLKKYKYSKKHSDRLKYYKIKMQIPLKIEKTKSKVFNLNDFEMLYLPVCSIIISIMALTYNYGFNKDTFLIRKIYRIFIYLFVVLFY